MKAKAKNGKPYTIISQNEKMDTSGMAGKPMEYGMMEYKPPLMPVAKMVHEFCEKAK
jgi:hypothetical protein